VSAGIIGYIIGGMLVSLFVPVLILIAAKFIPSWKQNPKVIYIMCVVMPVAPLLEVGRVRRFWQSPGPSLEACPGIGSSNNGLAARRM